MSQPKQPGASDGARIGEQIGGYRLLERLGDGSTSTVFLGEHLRLGRRAAIKVLASDFTDDQRTVDRLLNEARVVNDIRHPNIVDIWDFVEQDAPRRVALVMEYIEGPSLETFRGDPLPGTQALALSLQLVDAVQAAHARGVIHRDLKPANLLLTADPKRSPDLPLSLKVVDFGIAKTANPHAQGMTVSGTMLGTPAYMAPEQIAGSPPPSPATDVFALGAVIYELLTGERAYPSPRLQETIRMKLRGEAPPLRAPEVPSGDRIVAMVTACLARQPNKRPALDAVRSCLDRCLRAAAGEHMTDALELPTLGLTAAGPLPAAAPTELSEIPPGALEAARMGGAAQSAPTELPELMALLEAQDPDDEDEVGTELARPSVDLPAMDFATEQATAEPPPWAASQRDVATGMAVEGIPDHPSSPTNRVLDAITAEIPEPSGSGPDTSPGQLGLLAPAGVPDLGPEGDHVTRTVPRRDALSVTEPPDAPPPPSDPALAPTRVRREVDPTVRPDQLFASGVGLGPGVEDPPPLELPPKRASAPPKRGGGLGAVIGVVLVALAVVVAAVVTGILQMEPAEEPAPVEAPAPAVKPSVTPR